MSDLSTYPPPAQRRWPIWLLVALAAVFGGYAFFGVKPWELALGDKIVAGAKISLSEFIQEGIWWGSLVNFLGCLVLLGTARWWLTPSLAVETWPRGRACPAWFWIVLLLIVTGASLIRYPRLSHSLWNDEEYTLRRYVHGFYEEKPDDQIKFRKVDWETSLFSNRGANNHVLFSIAGKISLKVWQKFFSNGERPFSEAALRFPAYIAGLFGIAAVAVVMAFLKRPMLGLMCAFLLTIHPWHLRYSVEARGYAFLLLLATLSSYFLMRAVERGRWRNWMAFAGAQFAYMICFPGAVYLAITMNLTALGVLLYLHREARDRWILSGRLFISNMVSAMAFLLIMGPSLRQIRLYLDRDIAQGTMGVAWMYDIWSHIAAGIRYNVKEPDVPLALGLNMLVDNQPVVGWLMFYLLPALLLLGVVRVFWVGPLAVLAVLPPLLAGLLAYVHTSLTGNFLFSWYLLFLLPAFVMAVFFGVEMPWAGIRRPAVRNSLQGALGVGLIVYYLLATAQPRFLIRTHDRQPLRQTVVAMRGADSFFASPPIKTVSIGTSARQLQSYDPRIEPLDGSAEENTAAFERIIREANEERVPLFVTYANAKRVRKENPAILAILENSDRFEHVTTLYGLEEMFSFRVLRYRLPILESGEMNDSVE